MHAGWVGKGGGVDVVGNIETFKTLETSKGDVGDGGGSGGGGTTITSPLSRCVSAMGAKPSLANFLGRYITFNIN